MSVLPARNDDYYARYLNFVKLRDIMCNINTGIIVTFMVLVYDIHHGRLINR